MRKRHQLTLTGLAALLVSCNGSDTAEADIGNENGEPNFAGEQITLTGDALPVVGAASATPGAAIGITPAIEPAASGTAPDLTNYVGKFPFDEVSGVSWNEHPMVKAGSQKTVTDASVLEAMAMPGGPSAPIATYLGKVGSWGCQVHNCGDHQWAVLVDPRTGETDVCYHNAAKVRDKSRWFLANGAEEIRPGNCAVV